MSSSSNDSDDDSSVRSANPENHLANPDTLEDLFVDDDNCWLSEDQLFELQAERNPASTIPPPLKDWSEPQASTKTEVTVAKARRVAWDHSHDEILLHKKNVASALPGNDDPITKVHQHLFGSKSKLKALFCEELGISFEMHLGFVLSFFKSCPHKMSVKNLHDTDDLITDRMPNDQCNKVWRDVAKAPRHAHGESFWQQVESTLNKAHKELFAESTIARDDQHFRYIIGLDDDKLHYNWSKETDSDFLKKDHHAKDN